MTSIEEQLKAAKRLSYYSFAIFQEIGLVNCDTVESVEIILNDIASTVAAAKNYEATIERLNKRITWLENQLLVAETIIKSNS